MAKRQMTTGQRAQRREVDAKWRAANPEATKASRAKYYANHKDRVDAGAAKYRAANMEYVKARAARYYAEHKDAHKASGAKWRAANPDYARASSARYRAAHPDRVKARCARHYAAHPEYHKARRAHRKADVIKPNQERVSAIKLARGCALCGYAGNAVALEFDHIDPSKKRASVSGLMSSSWQIIQAEIDKCRLLCANCHRIETVRLKHYGVRRGPHPIDPPGAAPLQMKLFNT